MTVEPSLLLCKLLNSNDRYIRVVGETGSGKTTLVLTTLKELEVNFVYAVPEKSILVKAKRFGIPLKRVNMPYSQYKQVACTFRSIQVALQHNVSLSHFDVIVFDEFHTYVSESYWRRFEGFIERLSELYPHMKFIFVTATGSDINLTVWNEAKTIELESRNPFRERIKDVKVAYFPSNVLALEWLLEQECDVLYHNSIFAYFDSCVFNYGYQLVCSDLIENAMSNVFDEDGHITTRIYTTSIIERGIDIMNEGVLKVGMIVSFGNIQNVKQFIGRFRKAELEIYLALVDTCCIHSYLDEHALRSLKLNCELRARLVKDLEQLGSLQTIEFNEVQYQKWYRKYKARKPVKVFWSKDEIPRKVFKEDYSERLFRKLQTSSGVYYQYIGRSLVGAVLPLSIQALSYKSIVKYFSDYVTYKTGDYLFIIDKIELDQVDVIVNMISTYCKLFKVSLEEALEMKEFKDLLLLMRIHFGDMLVDEALKQFKCRRG